MSENFIEEWFLFPMQPTPNARLHLGHIAGPYLSSDVIRRWAILNYKKAYVACGTDVWENWVLEAARIEKKDVYNYVTNMDSLIREDLSLINIEIDFWINPLDSKFNNEYQTFHENLLKNLIVSNKVKLIKDIALFNNNNEISTGFSISGFCPSCNLNIRGNSCTNCGLGILPHEIKYPVEFKTNLKLIPKTLEVYYTNLKIKTKELLKTFYGFNDEVSFYFKNQTKILGLNIRITEPGVWGIESNIAPPNTVIRNSYYFYCIFLGLVISKILKKNIIFFLRNLKIERLHYLV